MGDKVHWEIFPDVILVLMRLPALCKLHNSEEAFFYISQHSAGRNPCCRGLFISPHTQSLFDFSGTERKEKATNTHSRSRCSHVCHIQTRTRASLSVRTRTRPVRVFAARKKKGKCGCMKMQKALVVAQKPCVSLCFQII